MVPPLPAYEGGSLCCFHFKARKCLIPSVSSTTKSLFHLCLTKHYYSCSLHPLSYGLWFPLFLFSHIVAHLLHGYNRNTCCSVKCVTNDVRRGCHVLCRWSLKLRLKQGGDLFKSLPSTMETFLQRNMFFVGVILLIQMFLDISSLFVVCIFSGIQLILHLILSDLHYISCCMKLVIIQHDCGRLLFHRSW